MVDFQHLRIFLRAAELKSFTKAAVVLGVSQPTISRLIRELEEEWDGELFYRTGRGAILSDFGEIAFARAKALVLDVEQTSEELRARSRLPTGVVSLGLPSSLVAPVVPQLVNQLRETMPGIRLTIYEGFSGQIERWLSTGRVEIGLYTAYREEAGKQDAALYPSRLVLVAPKSVTVLPAKIPFSDLAKFPLVLPPLPNGLRMIVESTARRKHISFDVVVDVGSVVAQKQIAEHCGCYTIKSPHTIADELARGIFATSLIVDPIIQRYVVLATTRQRPVSRAAREVTQRIGALLRSQSRRSYAGSR